MPLEDESLVVANVTFELVCSRIDCCPETERRDTKIMIMGRV